MAIKVRDELTDEVIEMDKEEFKLTLIDYAEKHGCSATLIDALKGRKGFCERMAKLTDSKAMKVEILNTFKRSLGKIETKEADGGFYLKVSGKWFLTKVTEKRSAPED